METEYNMWKVLREIKRMREKRVTEILNELNTGLYIKPEKMSFSQLLDTFMENRKEYLMAKTRMGYETIKENHLKPELGHIPITELRPLHIENYLNKTLQEGRKDNKKSKGKSLSHTTIRHHYRLIHTVLEYAVKRQMLLRNVAKNVEAPKPDTKEKPILGKEEIETLLYYVNKNYVLYIPIFIAVYTGMRLSEILALTWNDINMEEGFINIKQALKYTKKEGLLFESPKTSKSKRLIDISPIVTNTLKKHKTIQNEIALKTGLGSRYNTHKLVCCGEDGMVLCQESRHKERADFSAYPDVGFTWSLCGHDFSRLGDVDKSTSRGEPAYHAHLSM